jgi:hypothetical protein
LQAILLCIAEVAVRLASSWDVIGFPKLAMALYNPSLTPMYPKTELAAPPKSDYFFIN